MASAGLGSAQAMGVGRPQTLSALGQPLSLLFPVQLAAGESLSPDCVRAEVVAGESRLPPNLLQVQLEGESESSVRAVRLRSTIQVDEPLVNVQLSLGCPVRLTRQYTAFIDPPGAAQAVPQTAPVGEAAVVHNYSAALRAALGTAEAKPAELLGTRSVPEKSSQTVTEPAETSARAATAAVAPSPAASRPTAGKARPVEGGLKSAAAKPPSKATPAPSAGPKLQMEPAELLSALAASTPAPHDEEARQRLAKLEQSLEKMQSQQRESEARIAALQAQLAQAQSSSPDRPLVLGLGLLSLALMGFAAWLWRGRARSAQADVPTWWEEARAPYEVSPAHIASASDLAPAAVPDSGRPSAGHPSAPKSVPPDAWPAEVSAATGFSPAPAPLPASTPAPLELSSGLAPAAATAALMPPPEAGAANEPVSFELVEPDAQGALHSALPPLAVEGLIDLDQQVDFFQVLGQDEAAIDLLRSRLDAATPLPHLLLLSLYRRRGDLDLLAVLEADYAQRFGAAAPQQLGSAGAGLEAHPALLARLQACWSDHGACMALLQSLLGAAGGQQGLDLASCRELLLLYGVARDLSEHEVRSTDIDLFLPLDNPASDMMATMVWQTGSAASNSVSGGLEVDIPLGDDEVPTVRPGLPG